MSDTRHSKIRKEPHDNGSLIAGDYQHRALTEGPAIQRYWHREKQNILKSICMPSKDDIVLDCGCGSGVITHFLSPYCHRVVGVDINEDAIKYASQKFQEPNISFIQRSVDELDFSAHYFSKVFFMEVLEHLQEEQGGQLLHRIYTILKPGGTLFLTTPNYHGLWPLIEWIADRSGKVPQMDHEQHVAHYHKQKITGILHNIGFKNIRAGTFCTFAPFVSIINWNFAQWISKMEVTLNFPFGNLLYVKAEKEEADEKN
jgi:2-polyprenyl-3-methyl-5-hydroxy-6-metoxy-1,4-benzoquinol methylase